MCGDLLDDLSEIYKDIKRSLLIIDNGFNARETGLWRLKFQFENNWGDYCINALYACHYFLKNKSNSL